MKTIIFLFHPNIASSRINATLAQKAAEKFEVRNIAELYPDGNIDVSHEQKVLESADRIVLQFPLYWYNVPSLLKEWMDKVFTYGWAYGSTGKALQNKDVVVATSIGAAREAYSKEGAAKFTLPEVLRPLQASFAFVKADYKKPFYTYGALSLSDQDLENQAEEYIKYLSLEHIPSFEDR